MKDNSNALSIIQNGYSAWEMHLGEINDNEELTDGDKKALMKTMTLFRALGAGNDSSETSKKITKLLSIIPEKTSESNVPNTSSDRQTVTYDVPTLLISTSGEQYEAQPGYYFVGILDKDGRIVQGTLFDSGKNTVKTFFKKK